MNKLFLFTDHFYPINNNTSYYFNKIINNIGDNFKNKIEIIAPNYTSIKPDGIDKYKYNLIKINKFNKNNLFLRVYNFLKISLILSYYCLIKVKKNDIVYVNTNPVFLLLFITFLKIFKKFKIILQCNDIFPENLVAAKILKRNNIFYRFLLLIFNLAYKNIDHFISIGRDMSEYLEIKKNQKSKLSYIPYWSDNNLILPEKKKHNSIIKELKLENKIVYLFAGNLGRVQNIENLLKVIHKVNNKNIAFIFIGNGANKKIIIKYSNFKNIFYLGEKDFTEQQYFLNACDISVISLNKDIRGLGVPSKIYSFFSAAKPVLYFGPKNSEIYNLIKEFDNGWFFENNEEEKLLNFFNNFNDTSEINKKSNISHYLSLNQYSEKNIIKKYNNLFAQYLKLTNNFN